MHELRERKVSTDLTYENYIRNLFYDMDFVRRQGRRNLNSSLIKDVQVGCMPL